MKVISPTQGNTQPSARGMGYLQAAVPDLSPISRGLSQLGASLEVKAAAEKASKDKLKNYKSMIAFNEFQTGADELQLSLKKTADPAQDNYMENFESEYTNYENKFIDGLDPEFQEEYRVRTSEVRQSQLAEARKFQDTQRGAYYRTGVDKTSDKAKAAVAANTNYLEVSKSNIDAQIDAMDPAVISDLEKAHLKQENAKTLEGIAYSKEVEKKKVGGKQYASEMAQGINDLARDLGVNPIDLATVMSFESAGTFSTSIRGGKNNKHIGLIQFGEKEQKQYGASQDQSPREQLQAVKAYLVDRGFKPGMGILDLYSTINAGAPGRYNASDTSSGGTAGTVLDKVNDQMGGHRQNAIKLLGGTFDIPDGLDTDPRFNNVPYEDRIALRATADSNASKVLAAMESDRKEQQAGMVNDTLIGIMDGVYGRERVDEMREMGVVTDYDQIQKMYAAIDKRDKEANELDAAQLKLSGKIPWDIMSEDDRKLANTWFGKSGNDAMIGGDQEYFDKRLMPFVESTHMIPPDAIGMLDAMTRQTNAKQSLYALNSLAMLEDREPEAYNAQVPDRVKQNVDLWQANKNIMDQKELLDLVGGRGDLTKRQSRIILEQEATKLLSDEKTAPQFGMEGLLSQVAPDTWWPGDPSAEMPAIASARVGMQNERNQLFKENYIKTNGTNAEAALKMTDQQLLRTWGTTEFGGKKVLMKFPPAKAGYKPVAGSMKWTEDQARAELHIMPDTNMQLISDDVTQADVAAGRPASYLVATEKDGVWSIATEAGKRQTFQITPQLQIEEMEDFGQKQLEEEYKQTFLRYTEAAAMENVTGVPIPNELVTEMNDQRARVIAGKEAIQKSKQGPPATPQGTLRPEGPLALKLLGAQKKPDRVVPGVDVKTLDNYPPPALGMMVPGNIALNSPVKDAYLVEEQGQFVLLPKIDGLTKEAAYGLFQQGGEHLGVFQDEASAMEYLMSFKRKK